MHMMVRGILQDQDAGSRGHCFHPVLHTGSCELRLRPDPIVNVVRRSLGDDRRQVASNGRGFILQDVRLGVPYHRGGSVPEFFCKSQGRKSSSRPPDEEKIPVQLSRDRAQCLHCRRYCVRSRRPRIPSEQDLVGKLHSWVTDCHPRDAQLLAHPPTCEEGRGRPIPLAHGTAQENHHGLLCLNRPKIATHDQIQVVSVWEAHPMQPCLYRRLGERGGGFPRHHVHSVASVGTRHDALAFGCESCRRPVCVTRGRTLDRRRAIIRSVASQVHGLPNLVGQVGRASGSELKWSHLATLSGRHVQVG